MRKVFVLMYRTESGIWEAWAVCTSIDGYELRKERKQISGKIVSVETDDIDSTSDPLFVVLQHRRIRRPKVVLVTPNAERVKKMRADNTTVAVPRIVRQSGW